MTTAIGVSDQDLLTAELAAAAAADALRQAEQDESSGSLDIQLDRIEQLAAAEHRARLRHQRLETLIRLQHQAAAERLEREAELRPQIDSHAAELLRSRTDLRKAATKAVEALQAVAQCAKTHDQLVIQARVMLEAAELTSMDGAQSAALGHQGVQLNGVHHCHVPVWAALVSVFTTALGATLEFEHPIRREAELGKRLEVLAVERAALFTDPPATKERKSKNADA